jgi:polyisoprenyl-phosphate glycosyltransferase
MNCPRLSVVAPCYNESEVIDEFYRRTTIACKALNCTYELVFVNDGSKDDTWEKMLALARADVHVIAVNLSRNHGHQLALTAGLSHCSGERILIIDTDLQDPPELAASMMKIMDEQHADVVYGQRNKRSGETAFKLATASLFYRLIQRLSDVAIPRNTGDFRMMSRRALNVLQSMPERHRFVRGMVSWIGFRQVPLPYNRDARFAGETKYPLSKMLRFAKDAIASFSVKPLALASYAGFAFGILAIILCLYTMISWIFYNAVRGWTSLMAAVSLLGSIQLIVLGIFGEYLGRLYEESKGRPLFVVEAVVRGIDQVEAPQEKANP